MANIVNEVKNLIKTGYIKKDWFSDNIKNLLFEDADNKIIKCIQKSVKPNKADLEEKLKLIFKPFSLFPVNETVLVLVGQAPYPVSAKSNGMAFLFENNNMNTDDLLGNISVVSDRYKNETVFDIWDTNIKQYAKDNKILLLNKPLTYENEQTLQNHKDAWDIFIKQIVSDLIVLKGQPSTFLWAKHDKNILFQKIM